MRAIYEIVLQRGWAQLGDKNVSLSKMIDNQFPGKIAVYDPLVKKLLGMYSESRRRRI
jgi:hypothetical protein